MKKIFKKVDGKITYIRTIYDKVEKHIPESREKAKELLKEAYEADDVYIPALAYRLHESGFGLTQAESRKIVEEVNDELLNS